MATPLPAEVRAALHSGLVIPACPLALNAARQLDERRQRALIRYYAAAGAGGLAVGVHTTQFQIREPRFGLFEPVLALAADELAKTGMRARIGGICGPTRQALAEASLLARFGYHAGLLSLGALKEASDDALIEHARAVAEVIPIIGFYLQPAAGGRLLSHSFWRRFAEIENVAAIKVAPFNRYQTIDVVRAVAESGRDDIALYTGNDDNIVSDLLARFRFEMEGVSFPRSGRREESSATKVSTPEDSSRRPLRGELPAGVGYAGRSIERRFAGGLLGHWAVWTRNAVELLANCQRGPSEELWRAGAEVTDMNAAVFDAANGFVGCIAGLHEVLRRQGLLEGIWCLDPQETLSRGQAAEIDRVCRAYPHLQDDAFVREHLDEWMRA